MHGCRLFLYHHKSHLLSEYGSPWLRQQNRLDAAHRFWQCVYSLGMKRCVLQAFRAGGRQQLAVPTCSIWPQQAERCPAAVATPQ